MTEVSEEINRSNTICHYKRFSGFLRANCNACRVEFPKMVDLLRLFAEYGLEEIRRSCERFFGGVDFQGLAGGVGYAFPPPATGLAVG